MTPPLGLLLLVGLGLLLLADGRGLSLLLLIGEGALFLGLLPRWGQPSASAWLLVSWLAGLVLVSGLRWLPRRGQYLAPLWGARLAAWPVVIGLARLGTGALKSWFGAQDTWPVFALLFWILLGMLLTGLSTSPWSLTIGVLTTLSGGTALYGLLEPSRLMLAGLLGLQSMAAWIGTVAVQRLEAAS